MLNRLLTHVAEVILPESQCGFRRGSFTIDMVFVARLLKKNVVNSTGHSIWHL